jgi:RNA polymerase sigma-70 factor (ECF subfamily)
MVYAELHRMAAAYLRRERIDHTLQPTALINEAYLRLVGSSNVSWESRAHFFGISARVMRRILVDHARQHQADKRGASIEEVAIDAANEPGSKQEEVDLVALDAALSRLAELDPEQSKLVELRYFAGLTIEEAAQAMSLSVATARFPIDLGVPAQHVVIDRNIFLDDGVPAMEDRAGAGAFLRGEHLIVLPEDCAREHPPMQLLDP